MRRLTLTLVPLLLVACYEDRGVTEPASFTVPSKAALASADNQGADRFTYRVDLPFNWLLLKSELPCLTEDIQLSGTLQEHLVFISKDEPMHLIVHQTTDNITVVGLTTGDRYAFSGPLTQTVSGSTSAGTPVEFSFHNINHFVGPGPDANVFFHTTVHVTFDRNTGEVKVEVVKDSVRC